MYTRLPKPPIVSLSRPSANENEDVTHVHLFPRRRRKVQDDGGTRPWFLRDTEDGDTIARELGLGDQCVEQLASRHDLAG